MRTAFALAMIVVFSSMTTAADENDDTVTAATEPVKTENTSQRVCRRVKMTGSRIKQRVCMTNMEWEEAQRQTDADRRSSERRSRER